MMRRDRPNQASFSALLKARIRHVPVGGYSRDAERPAQALPGPDDCRRLRRPGRVGRLEGRPRADRLRDPLDPQRRLPRNHRLPAALAPDAGRRRGMTREAIAPYDEYARERAERVGEGHEHAVMLEARRRTLAAVRDI